MMKKTSILILIALSCMTVFADSTLPVNLDTNKISYFECGFSKGTGPGMNGENMIQSKSIGNGGFSPTTSADLKVGKSADGRLKIYSDPYAIWIFKIGVASMNVTLTGTPLTNKNKPSLTPIGYDVYIDKSNPDSGFPAFSVDSRTPDTTYSINDAALNNKFIQYWETKFMIKIKMEQLPLDIEPGTYSGTLQLVVRSN